MKLAATLISLFFCTAVFSATVLHLEKPPVGLESADAAYRARRDETKARTALKLYQEQWKKRPLNAEIAWRVSMANHFVALRYAKDDEEKEKLFADGRDAGIASVKLKEDCAPCHFWTALNMTLYGRQVGKLKMLFSLADIRKHTRRVIELDKTYAYGSPFRLLGLIEKNLPGFLGGDDERAKDLFETAIEVAPDEPMNYQEMAELLDDKFDDPVKALAVARKGMTLSKPASDRVESVDALAKLAHLTSELEKKVAKLSPAPEDGSSH